MRWYVSRGGETVGPVEESQVAEWVRGGMWDAQLRGEHGGDWQPVHKSPFAGLLPTPEVKRILGYRARDVKVVAVILACIMALFAVVYLLGEDRSDRVRSSFLRLQHLCFAAELLMDLARPSRLVRPIVR